MKPVVWVGDSLHRLRELPADAMHDLGYELELVQTGSSPKDWKAMPSIGLGVSEIRVHSRGEFRMIYVAKYAEAIYVLHVFRKKSRATALGDIELARQRLRGLLAMRGRR